MIRGNGRPDRYLRKDGTPVPSVTEILGRYKPQAALTAWAVKLAKEGKDHKAEAAKAARWGAVVHDVIEAFISDSAEPDPKDGDNLALFETAVMAARAACNHDVIKSVKDDIRMVETPLVSEFYGFGGTFDALTKSDVIVDWKTSGEVYPEYVLQMGAYHLLLDEYYGGKPSLPSVNTSRSAKIVKIGKKTVGDLIYGTGEVTVIDVHNSLLNEAGMAFAQILLFHQIYSHIERFIKEAKSDTRSGRKRRK